MIARTGLICPRGCKVDEPAEPPVHCTT